ncbi:uncharacterized protein F4822DRAFT_445137 [Hypoxylon trugodes]|uniref:uncharacterized protein n=1 Tax=Hypoxylon trugodes TaxID=326681 RepID=UPI00218F3CB3|nr:uncharacterized protein F4822DRAFT_445137 [Hypoxylon trugodes]KAI1387060.1 hypothetical protein F4822DRAFT_445137 [Hypoxylon trugodes]
MRRGLQALSGRKGGPDLPWSFPQSARGISHIYSQRTFALPDPIPEFAHIPPISPTSALTPAPCVPTFIQPEPSSSSDDEFWRRIPSWRDVSFDEFGSWGWNVKHVVEANLKKPSHGLIDFFNVALPNEVPRRQEVGGLQSRDEFIGDVLSGIKKSAMALRVMPYVLARINWKDPANDPIFKQFIPLGSMIIADHPILKLDSLGEREDSPVPGLVHRYPDKALLLPISVCPTYCSYCTRSYAVGPATGEVEKDSVRAKLQQAFDYIESREELRDIVVSGGDAFYLHPELLEDIGDRLIGMKNIERFRFASKGLAVSPQRFLDHKDPWVDSLIRVSDKARKAGKHMAFHTHFNHPNEISWITEQASLKLLQSGVTVRNQTVLLRGINDNIDTMITLIKKLAKMAIQPYYVYQCDMVPKIEHLRTPLSTILDIEAQVQGAVAGFFIPKFVVDLPGGGGKRPASLYESYDRKTGISTFTQPSLKGKDRDHKVYEYHDPVNAQSSS